MERFLSAATEAVTISGSVDLRSGARASSPPAATISCWLAPEEGGRKGVGGGGGVREGGGGREKGGRGEGEGEGESEGGREGEGRGREGEGREGGREEGKF